MSNIKITFLSLMSALVRQHWARLPFQAVLIAWAYWYTRQPETQPGASEVAKEAEPLIHR